MGVVVARGPAALPLVGHLPAYLSDKLGFLTRCAAAYGPVVALRIGEPTLLLSSPDDIQHVLLKNSAGYSKSPRLTGPRGKALSGSGLLTSSPAEHPRQKRALQPAFAPQQLEAFGPIALAAADRFVAECAGKGRVELRDEMERLTRSVIVEALFGPGVDDADLTWAIAAHRRYIEYVHASLVPFPESLPTRAVREEKEARRIIDRVIRAEIARRRGAKLGPDLLSGFLAARYPDGQPMSEDLVSDEALTMLSTGYETTGDALAWTLYLLAGHPEALRRVVAELDAEVGDRRPQVDDLARLPYLGQVLSESLRLYPPTWIFVRIADADDALPSGPAVTRGTKLYLCPYVVHRSTTLYSDPLRFDPDRFLPAAVRERPRFAYFPFGGGPRICLGESLAKLEARLVLATLARRLRFELVPGQDVTPRAGVTLRPKNGVHVTVRPA